MINFKSLESTSIDELHKTFIEAFSDYQVNLNMSLSSFEDMLERHGYLNKASVGAFDDDKLIGFLLVGIRMWNGKMTAYDTGTAIIKKYRSHGITSKMFLKNKELLMAMGIETYLLEVIQNNDAAVKLYRKQGFEISRNFDCFKLKKSDYKADLMNKNKIENINLLNDNYMSKLKNFMDFEPSWQNSVDSIMAVPHNFICSAAFDKENIMGYGIMEKGTGDIVQLAVDKNYRRRGIGTGILNNLISNADSDNISILNVDSEYKNIEGFLSKAGFECYVKQYEMFLKL